jgi:Uma2 family endonuclease
MGLPLRDQHLHTYGEYLSWPDDLRYELIDGRAYAMSPAPTRRHQQVVGELFRQIANALQGRTCQAYVAPFDVRLPRGNEADEAIDTVVQPDIAVFCDRSRLNERGARGAPDWIIEVLSPGTASHDQLLKRDLYERHGVAEYWLVHPGDRLVTVYRLLDGAYGKPHVQEFAGSLCPTIPDGVQVDLDLLAGALAD